MYLTNKKVVDPKNRLVETPQNLVQKIALQIIQGCREQDYHYQNDCQHP